ncbi:polyribonucleotide nucleotidyltransferase [Thiohalobacter thiocyanaticus]|uniref:Polyribonucleotide nucleotidyltransferase n=1 Tax=Thiohalobacter thiocyanaticus TaxID=585455 RepID=A0A1Z4VMA8_9GAMM|nr:SIR2 family protein [Thiohalobacter thiocyanaticus]BAZ92643.1 polyribonucleotide nucleotidyltransferase [Thiohalobacter thiocyanaticus]
MKRKENRKRVKRLFIFGAGASYGASAARGGKPERQTPLDIQFCQRIEQLDTQKPTWVSNSRDFILKEWKDHVQFSTLGLERAIIRQMGHMDFIDGIHPRRKKNNVSKANYLNSLSHLICYVLRRAKEPKNSLYKALADKYFSNDIDDIDDRIITFNYDELLDNWLLHMHTPQSLYFDRIKRSKEAANRRTIKCDHPLMIKLHGSVNWRCTTTEFEQIVAGKSNEEKAYRIESIWMSKRGTPAPHDDSSPLIIPPLPQKPITRIELFCFLWTKAYEYLHEAEELIICGYSLPDTDNLAQSLFSNFTNRKLKNITIVDPNPGIMKKWRDLMRRKNVNPGARWSYFESFEEYMSVMDS